ncbi:hypothetical protein WDU94_003106 [Cyamophila willieti]
MSTSLTSIGTIPSSSSSVPSSIVKLRTAGFSGQSQSLADSIKSPTGNGIPPKSPLPSKYSKDKGFVEFGAGSVGLPDKPKGQAALLGTSLKQRPWSMVSQGDTKPCGGDYKSLSLDINSGPASLPLSINSENRSSVKAMAANLNNKAGSESPELKKKPILEPPPPGAAAASSLGSVRGYGKKPVPQPRPSIVPRNGVNASAQGDTKPCGGDYKSLSLDINSGPASLPLSINSENRSSVKAMAANLNNKAGSESPELKKKPILEPPPPGAAPASSLGSG